MTAEDFGQLLVAVLGTTTVLCLVPIVVVQLVEYVSQMRRSDGLQSYRLVTASIILCAATILCWRMAIWLDVTFADQAYLGPTGARWPLDLVIGLWCQFLAAYPTYIFWRDRLRSRRARSARVRP